MIRYEGFAKRYGRVIAVAGLDLELRAGETLGLIGPNGSGKSTTLKAAVGLVRPTRGRVLIDGLDAARGPDARARLGYLPQRLSFPEGVTAREAMRFYARLRCAGLEEVEPLLERLGLADAAARPSDGFSGGMHQRLGLAIALLGRPRVLVLDEPSAALDPTGALLVRDLLGEIGAEGTTVLLSSHDLGEIEVLADRVAIFTAGAMAALGTLAELEGRAGIRGLEAVYRRLADGPGLSAATRAGAPWTRIPASGAA
jgi:ABC-type multidrug transport system ATPase subunit